MKIFFRYIFFVIVFISLIKSVPVIAQSKVLVFHKTNGWRHTSIEDGIQMIENLGTKNGWTTDDSEESLVFTEANLSQYDVVVWCNTSGDGLLSPGEQAAFENYIVNGGGFVGIHAATDTYRDGSWPFYNELVGGIVQTDPNHTSNDHNATMDVLDVLHPTVSHLGSTWNKNEEYYYWEQNGGQLSNDNNILLQVRSTGDESYDATRPITWYKTSITVNDITYHGIKSFYTALGHNDSDYTDDSDFITMVESAIIWAATFQPVNNELDETPLGFGLAQNYPNPFNPATTINYTIEHAGAVNLSVYNLMGQRVATLVNEAKTAGTHSVRWNAAGAASGMYYYRLEANGQSITRKMTLIK